MNLTDDEKQTIYDALIQSRNIADEAIEMCNTYRDYSLPALCSEKHQIQLLIDKISKELGYEK